MDVGMLHGHRGVVILYLILLAVKVAPVLMGQKGLVATINGRTKIPSRILEVLMLGTGGYLISRSPDGLATYNLAKYLLMVVAIVLGVIGIKRMNKPMAAASVLVMAYIMGVAFTRSLTFQNEEARVQAALAAARAEQPDATYEHGQIIFETACQRCHGFDGRAEFLKSKNLATTEVADNYKANIIRHGKGLMPAYPYLTDAEVQSVVTYLNGLKK